MSSDKSEIVEYECNHQSGHAKVYITLKIAVTPAFAAELMSKKRINTYRGISCVLEI
jgi:hypothetical protein